MSPHHRLQSYYGYAFESWCTSDAVKPMPAPPASVPPPTPAPKEWGGDVDTNVQWCSVVKTKLGGTRMVLGGEVDCVRGMCVIVIQCSFESVFVLSRTLNWYLMLSLALLRYRNTY